MSFQQYHIVTPLADHVGVLTDTGFDTDVPLYTIADPTPRAQTHARCASPYTPTQQAAIETPTTGARFVYPNSDFTEYNKKTQPGVPAARLAALGLTTSPT